MSHLYLYKPYAMTPLECLEEYRRQHPELAELKMCYAGRLDPMASGILLVLTGEECKNRSMYERLSKTYEFELIPGVETDTYDIMGLPKNGSMSEWTVANLNRIDRVIREYIGEFRQPYPPFSSARVNGKPLYYWARKGEIDTINVPVKNVEIYDARAIETRTLTRTELLKIIVERISKTSGQFRQTEIINAWTKLLSVNPKHIIQTYRCSVSCSSGTYIRSLAHEMGKKLGTGAIAFNIRRVKIGETEAGMVIPLARE